MQLYGASTASTTAGEKNLKELCAVMEDKNVQSVRHGIVHFVKRIRSSEKKIIEKTTGRKAKKSYCDRSFDIKLAGNG